MEFRIPSRPNPGLTQFLASDKRLAAAVTEIADVLVTLWEGTVARDTERLANSVEQSLEHAMGFKRDRLGVAIHVNVPWAAPHEFGFVEHGRFPEWKPGIGGHEWQTALQVLSAGV